MNRLMHIGIILASMTVLVPSAMAAPVEAPGDIFVLDFTLMKNNSVNISGVSIMDGQSTDFGSHDGQEPNYQLTMGAANGTELFRQGLRIEFTAYVYPQGARTVDEREFYWRLPYHYDAHEIRLRDLQNTETVMVVNLTDRFCGFDQACSGFCDGKEVDVDCTCGDGVCQDIENTELCDADCADSASTGDPDDTDTVEDPGQDGVNIVVMAMIAVIVLVIGAAVVYLWREVEIE